MPEGEGGGEARPAAYAAGPLAGLGWLQGSWGAREGTRCTTEWWQSPRGTVMMGWSTTVDGDRTVEWEHLRIEAREDGSMVYVATPSGQATTEFRITRSEATDIGDVRKELIVVDDGSTDGTRDVLKQLSDSQIHKIYFHGHNMGKGAALRTALTYASGDIILVQDADLEYDPAEYAELIKPILEGRADVRVVGDRFVFQSEVLFDAGEADISPEGQAELAKLAEAVKQLETEIPSDVNWVLRIDGHTDKRPINTAQFPSNWELSAARAISVAKYLIAQGVSAQHLVPAGFGEFSPIDGGDSDEAYARNRRIEFKLTE